MLRLITVLLVSASALFAQDAARTQLEKEKSIGWRMTDDLLNRYGRAQAPQAQAYLERLTAVIWGEQPGGQSCCMVEVHEDGADVPATPTPLPGGHLFVPLEYLRANLSEADFVRELAHAVAHIRLRDWWPQEQFVSIPALLVVPGDDPKYVPLGLRDEFDAREERAEALVGEMVANVALGTGEYEQMLESLPPSPVRPSLLSGRPSLVR